MPSTTLNLGRVKGSMWYTGTADSNVDIASALTSAGYTPIKLDMYLNTSNGNVYQYAPVDDGLQWTLKGNLQGIQGEKGDKGDTGAAGANGADGADALVYYGETIRIFDPLSINQIMNFDKSKFNREPVFGEYFVAIIKFFESFDDYSSGIYKTYLGYYEVNNANGVDSDGETIIVFAVLRTFVETTGTSGATGADGAAGADGATFTPSVDAAGNLSWTNDGGKENPPTVSIKGEKGDKGDTGAAGANGADGADGVTPEIGENGNWWINGEDTGKPSRGEVGQDGAQGRGYYRTEAILSTATASIERSRINPVNGKLLVSDTIVDRNGLVFAVTKECDVGDETVYIAYRTSIKGADGLGVPAGGTTGQILAKKTKTDYETEWIDAPSGGGSTMYAHHLRISDYGFATGTEQVNIAATIINTSANAITFDTLKAYLETLDNGYSKRLMVSGCAHDGTGVTAIVYGLMLSSNNIIAIYNAMTSTQIEQGAQLSNSAMVDDTVVQIC